LSSEKQNKKKEKKTFSFENLQDLFKRTNERERERERKDFDPFFCVIYLFDMVIEKEKVQLI